MFERIGRSWHLVRAAASVVRQDKELMVFPLLSGAAGLIVIATFLVPLAASGTFERLGRGGEAENLFYVWLFLLYVVLYFVVIFFNAALIGAAMIRLEGGDPTVRDGLAMAGSRVGTIFGYAVVSATVGVILNMLEERFGAIGRFVIGLIGLAWSVATFLVVPIIVARNVGPLAAVRESADLLRRTWGENLAGSATIGLVFGIIGAAIFVVGAGVTFVLFGNGATAAAFLVGALTVLGVIAVAIVQAALSGVFAAALFRYATTGNVPEAFGGDALRNAFVRRG